MTMPPMVGLTGYAYAGKDTLAGLLVLTELKWYCR